MITEKSNIRSQIIDWATHGVSKGEIIDRVKSSTEFNEQEILDLIQEAIEELAKSVSQDPKETIKSHIALYEQIFDYFKTIGHTKGMNRAMKAKEKLLGISEKSKITVDQKIERKVVKSAFNYDYNRLTPAERERWDELWKKMKIHYGCEEESK